MGEREWRADAGEGSRKYHVMGGRPVPPWKKILNVPSNKQALVAFLCNHMETNAKSIGLAGVQEAVDFYSTHEEADTKMILHAVHANNVFERNDITGRVIIKTPDTDVLVLAIHYYLQMDRVKEFWIETGTVTRTTDLQRFIPVHDICHSQSPLFLKVLPAIHTLTGCDSTSVFFGIGKKTVY